MPAVQIGALDTGDAFCIVSAIKDFQNGFLDADDAVAAVGCGILLLIAFLEGRKMGLEDTLDEVVAPRDVA